MSGGALLRYAKVLEEKASFEREKFGMNIRGRMQELQMVDLLEPKPNHCWDLTLTGQFVCNCVLDRRAIVDGTPENIDMIFKTAAEKGLILNNPDHILLRRNDFIRITAELIGSGEMFAEDITDESGAIKRRYKGGVNHQAAKDGAIGHCISLDSIWCLIAAKVMEVALSFQLLHKVCAGRDGICLVRGNR